MFTRAMMALALAMSAGAAWSADRRELQGLHAPPPTPVSTLPANASARAVEFARIVIHPKDGEPWAYYFSLDNPGDGVQLLTWRDGAVEGDTAAFARAFNEELRKAGFRTQAGDSLFAEDTGAADLKVAVRIDDLKGRFCHLCLGLRRGGANATVVMTAHWEVYSGLDRRVVARVTTSGGVDSKAAVGDSVMPFVLDAFRENVRQLSAKPEFRDLVLRSPAAGADGAAAAPSAGLTPISLAGAASPGTVAQALKSVAVIYAADGSGSGFLVSRDGYVLTNSHVVGGSKYVKVKWSDGVETLGEVVRSDRRRDVALVKTDPHGQAPLKLRLSGAQVGEPVFAIGTPLADRFQNTLTKGIVSASRTYEGQPFIQSDVAINHGNSGGPLLDEKASVLGLTVSGIMANEAPVGLNFFIPIEDALRVLALKPAA